MAIQNFIPSIWSAQILRGLERSQVWTQAGVVNRDYEGEIREAGDRVKINSISDPTIKDYTKNTKIADPEVLNDSQKELIIDQQKYFNFMVDDIDKAQANVNLIQEPMRRAGVKLNDVSGNYIANLALGADTQNVLGSADEPLSNVDKTTAYEFLTELRKRLNKAGVPQEGRWVIVPDWLEAVILNAKIVTDVDPQSAIANGVVGKVAGFTVLASSTFPTATGAGGESDVVVAGHGMAISFAEQIVSTEAYRPEGHFSDAVKGLHVYGGKLIRPEALTIAYATPSNGTFGA